MVEIGGKCPLCKEMIVAEIPESIVKNRSSYPISVLIDELFLRPEPHKHIFYLDAHMMVRGVSYVLVPYQKLTQFKIFDPVDKISNQLFFEIIDMDHMIIDARLMRGLSYLSLTEETLDKVYTIKRFAKKELITEEIGFHTITSKNPGLIATIYFQNSKAGILYSFSKQDLDPEIISALLKYYSSKFTSEKAVKEVLKLAIRKETELDSQVIRYMLDNRSIQRIQFDKIEASLHTVGDDIKAIVNKIKETDYAGKNISDLAEVLHAPLHELAAAFLVIDFVNALDLRE